MQEQLIPTHEEVYTVSQLNAEVKFLLEKTFTTIWVEAEISNFAAPNSGHWYFSLKDAQAQVRCAMFRGSQRQLAFVPKDGMHVLARCKVSLYENRGEFQLIVEHLEERGEGKLRRAFELLKKKLEAEGLFDHAHKKYFPEFPKKIGVITSATGAAIRDILTVLKRRFPCAPVIIYPTLVQGESAAPAIVAALHLANQRNECDVLILARGGGSLEDLWPFNEEMVARAIFISNIPIISGVGHEVDFTIADFVADLRAPTPSAAAEMITPDCALLLSQLKRSQENISRLWSQFMMMLRERLDWICKHLANQHPKKFLLSKMQQLDFSELTLIQLKDKLLQRLHARVQDALLAINQQSPAYLIKNLHHQLQLHQQKMMNIMHTQLNKKQNDVAQSAGKLNTLSPLATLERGYAIACKNEDHIIRQATEVLVGEHINVRLHDGSLKCVVEEIHVIPAKAGIHL